MFKRIEDEEIQGKVRITYNPDWDEAQLFNAALTAIANAQLKEDWKQHNQLIRELFEEIEKHKDVNLGYDWGLRKGAPIVIFTFDPFELQVLKDKYLKEVS